MQGSEPPTEPVNILELHLGALSRKPAFEVAERLFLGQEFLSLLVDLALNLELDLAKLLLFPTELFFLESDALGGEILWQNRIAEKGKLN